MRVHADEQRTGDALCAAILAERLADRQDVIFVEAVLERRAAMAGCAKSDRVGGVAGVRLVDVIRGNEAGNVGQDVARRGLAGQGMERHEVPLW